MTDFELSGSASSGLATALLPAVVRDATAAVLLIDLDSGQVTYANDLARELAPDCELPVSVDEWSAAAGLEDVSGADLPQGEAAAERPVPAQDSVGTPWTPVESLIRVARGEPVSGEAVTAARRTAMTARREPLWVLGLPLVGAPEAISSSALVVFIPARNAASIIGIQESAATLRERAVLATRVSFTITDPTLPDDPLVWVNPAFTETTGYSFEESVGRNCRFLQGPNTDPTVVAEISRCLNEGLPFITTLLNYRKDGTRFWNELSVSPVRSGDGTVTHFVGVQADVTARVEAQIARDDALEQVAESAQRLSLLADFTTRLTTTQQPQRILEMLAGVLVPRLGRWCAIFTVDSVGQLTVPLLRHADEASDPGVRTELENWLADAPAMVADNGPVWRVLRGESSQVTVADLGEDDVVTGTMTDLARGVIERLGTGSVLVIPLRARRGILGCAIVATEVGAGGLDGAALVLVRDLAARAGLMLENTRLYTRERATATTLQLSLLPTVPRIDGLEISASYVPAADQAAVGGDWYDVFRLRDGGVGVVVGDVMGHDIDSAARMGKLSTIVRSYAWRGGRPRDILSDVDELLVGSQLDILATCMLGCLRLHEGGATLHYSSAGHPPAIARLPGGDAVVLGEGRGPMMGVSALLPPGSSRPVDAEFELARGSTLICFSDGLADSFSPEPDMDVGLAELSALTTALPPEAAPNVIIDVLAGAAVRHTDDVAIIAIRIL